MDDKDRLSDSAMAINGMVASAHPLASLAGLEALKQGGTAMDACLAMAGVTSVVLPHMCGLGGDAFFIYYEKSTGKSYALNGSGPGGDGLTLEKYGGTGILPQDGPLSVAVPGAPLVYEMGANRFGRLGLRRCFQAGIDVAEGGFAVTPELSGAIHADRAKISKFPETRDVFLPGGRTPLPGSTMRRKDMADAIRLFAEGGTEYIYKGAFHESFLKTQSALGGLFTGREFPAFLAEPPVFYSPIETGYRGYTVMQTSPVSQGFLVLEELNFLEHFPLAELEPLGPEAVHLMVEAKKIAFADRNKYAGDPDCSGFDVARFISKDYAADRVREISKDRAANGATRGAEGGIDTTSFVAWDREGNVCSFIHSNAFAFGSGVSVQGTGVLLNNRAGRSFVLKTGHPNSLLPRKKPMHTLNCYLVTKDGRPFIAGGTPGGDGQPQWNMQMLSLMLDHGMGPQEAADFPRWTSSPGTDVISLGKQYELRLESRFPGQTVDALRAIGHTVHLAGPWNGGGGAQIIMKDPGMGVLLGGSDTRLKGLALGY